MLGQERDRQHAAARVDSGVRQPLAEDPREPGAEERQGQARHDLVGPEVDRHDAVEQAEQAAGEHRRDHARSTGCRSSAAIEKPATAPMSIIPSTPRFRTPERSAKISPIAAKSRTVPAGDAARRSARGPSGAASGAAVRRSAPRDRRATSIRTR